MAAEHLEHNGQNRREQQDDCTRDQKGLADIAAGLMRDQIGWDESQQNSVIAVQRIIGEDHSLLFTAVKVKTPLLWDFMFSRI